MLATNLIGSGSGSTGGKMHTLVRRLGTPLIAAATLASAIAPGVVNTAHAQSYPSSISVGINLPFTGADAADAVNIRDGALMAIEEINNKGGINGQIKINAVVKDDGTVAAGQYDPAQAATNTKEFVADSTVMAVVGPQMSGSEIGRAHV